MKCSVAFNEVGLADLLPHVSDAVARATCCACACRCGINVRLRGVKVCYVDGSRDRPVNCGGLSRPERRAFEAAGVRAADTPSAVPDLLLPQLSAKPMAAGIAR